MRGLTREKMWMLALGTLDTHMEKKDGWFIQGLDFANFVEQKDKKGSL